MKQIIIQTIIHNLAYIITGIIICFFLILQATGNLGLIKTPIGSKKMPKSLRKKQIRKKWEELTSQDIDRESIKKKLMNEQKKQLIRKFILGEILIGEEEIVLLENLDYELINYLKRRIIEYDPSSEKYESLIKILSVNLQRKKTVADDQL